MPEQTNQSRAEPPIGVVGIGNALVDVISHESHEFVAEAGLVPGSMNLIEEDRFAELYGSTGPGIEASGGSAANTMAGIASFGGSAHYLGRICDDQLGRVFAHDISSIGVGFSNNAAPDGPATGSCIVLVTPDAQRTLNTYLGAAALFGADDLDAEVIASAGILYLEGYLFDRAPAQEAFVRASQIAHEAGRMVSLTLSDSFCVDRHREAFLDLADRHIDLVFANEAELRALYETDDLDSALDRLGAAVPLAAVTRSEKGSVIVEGGRRIDVPAEAVDEVVDTTGAGDLYAAGFLYGLSTGADLATCGRYGSIAAAEVISHIGPRPEVPLAGLIGR